MAVPLYLTIFILLLSACIGKHHHYHLHADHAFMAFDGVTRLVVVANNSFPGPEIRVTKGDTVTMTLANELDNEGLTIHWHGLYMRGTPWADGVAFGSQCPMIDKQVQSFTWHADQVGTYFWHAHAEALRAEGMMGPLIIEDPDEPFEYDGEYTAMLSDWYNKKTTRMLAAGLMQQKFIWVGDPQSVLVNGVGCSLGDVGAENLTYAVDVGLCQSPTVFEVEPSKTYRLRVINSAAMSYFSFVIEGHNMTVVEIDGHYVEPYTVTSLEVNTGMRFSVLVTADQPVANYWVQTQARWRVQRQGQAVLRYIGAEERLPTTAIPTYEAVSNPVTYPYLDTTMYAAAEDLTARLNKIVSTAAEALENPCPYESNKQMIVQGTQERMTADGLTSFTPYTWQKDSSAWNSKDYCDSVALNAEFGHYLTAVVDGKDVQTDGFLRWPVSITHDTDNLPSPGIGIAGEMSETPVLLATYYNLYDEEGEEEPPIVHHIESGDVITVILQNARTGGGKWDQHPWHLHGHFFWVLGHGMGKWNSSCHALLNTKNPPIQDTVTVLPFGWTAIRFRADNPGVHPLHCHIDWHVEMGMHLIFVESEKDIPEPPKDFPTCGKITQELIAKKSESSSSDALEMAEGAAIGAAITGVFCLVIIGVLYLVCNKTALHEDKKNVEMPISTSNELA